MSKKNKMEKFQEIIMDRFHDYARDDANALYDANVDAFASFIDHMFGSDIAASIMRSIESDVECIEGKVEVSTEPVYDWSKFRLLCERYGPVDDVNYYKDNWVSPRDAKSLAKLREVFDALNKHLESGDITEIVFDIELRTPYTWSTPSFSFSAEELSKVKTNLDLRELIYNGVYRSIDEIINSIYGLLNTMNPYNSNDGDKLPPAIIEQYKEMVERLKNPTTNGIRVIRPLKDVIARQLATEVYEDIAMFVGTIDGLLGKVVDVPSGNGITINDIGLAHSVIRVISVYAAINGSGYTCGCYEVPHGGIVSPDVCELFTNPDKVEVEYAKKGEVESE